MESGQSEAVANQVREELARRRLSRQWLADEAKISISTLEKALSGRRPFTLGTVVRLEEALKMRLRAPAGEPAQEHRGNGCAPDEMGAYARQGVRWLEGEYLTLRPSFSDPEAIYAYRTIIEWDEAAAHLKFAESDRDDAEFTQQGFVSFPHQSGHIYLVTRSAGQYRLVLLGRPTIRGAMNGVLTTLVSGSGAQLVPAASPIALIPTGGLPEPDFGLVRPGDRCFDDFRARVDEIARKGFALFPR